MDEIRLRKLAGMDTAVMEALEASIKELDEEMHMGRHMTVDTGHGGETVESLTKKVAAVQRALQIIPRLPNEAYRTKHLKRILNNFTLINQALKDLIRGEQEDV